MAQTLGGRYAALVIQAVGMVVLARLLAPADFGVFAAAAAILAVCSAIVDFGLASHFVRAPSLERQELRAGVGLSLALTLLCAAALGALSLAPGLVGGALLPLMALSLLPRPLLLPLDAALQHELRFGLLTLISVFRTLVQVCTSVTLALMGWGVWSLAAGFALEGLASGLALALFGDRSRLVRPSLKGWRPLLAFGLRFSSTGVLGNAGDAAIALLVGRFLGLADLGVFNRSRTVVSLVDKTVLEGVAPVVLPALSRVLRDGMTAKAAYLTKIDHLTAVCWPLFALIALCAEPLVTVLLGPQWPQAVPAVQILAAAGLFFPYTRMSMKVFVALGLERQYARLQAVHHLARVALAGAGALISLEAACAGVAAGFAVDWLLISPALKRATGAGFRDLAGRAGLGAVVTLGALAPAMAALWLAQEQSAFVQGAAAGCAAGVGWLTAVALSRHPLWLELRAFLPGASVARTAP
jgi:O-antigen/teichoic acid export membrane protein